MKTSPARLELHSNIQGRVQLDMIVIQEYAETMQNGGQFPPVQAISENGHLWVWDGFHRVMAAREAGVDIEVDARDGTFQEAQWLASGANRSHGLRRTNADKRRAVEMALKADAGKSNAEVARHCGVTHPTVQSIRSELESSCKIYKIERREIKRGTTTYTQDVSNIGRPQNSERISVAQLPATGPIIEPTVERKSTSTFNRTNENIEWAAWSWNPVTGCNNTCEYCYARDIAKRFYPQGFKPTFHENRLPAPTNTKPIVPRWDGDIGHKGVFVCSMADLFGDWVPQSWIDAVIDVVRNTPQWNFIFLTKNPKRLVSINWPTNAWVGTTVDTQARVIEAEKAFTSFSATVRFLSCEPMLEPLEFTELNIFDWVIIGGRSKNSKLPEFQPEFDWVLNLTMQAKNAECKVYWKTNLSVRPREYPV